jgi:hypothetical protein
MDCNKIFFINIFGLILKTAYLQTCLITNSTEQYGTLTKSCFGASVSTLSEIIVHTAASNVVGITFNFLNNASATYIQSGTQLSQYTNNSINLSNNQTVTSKITGITASNGVGVDTLSFRISNSSSNITFTYGTQANGAVKSLDTSALNTTYFELNTIYVCTDCNTSFSNLPALMIDYTYNRCTTIPWKEWNPWSDCSMFR